jgi:hypothetical protein
MAQKRPWMHGRNKGHPLFSPKATRSPPEQFPPLDKSQISDVSGNGHSIKPEVLSSLPEINELVALDASHLTRKPIGPVPLS